MVAARSHSKPRPQTDRGPPKQLTWMAPKTLPTKNRECRHTNKATFPQKQRPENPPQRVMAELCRFFGLSRSYRGRAAMLHNGLSPAQAGEIGRQGRRLLQARKITTFQYALLDIMLWRIRKPGCGSFIASMGTLARLAGQARSTIAAGLNALQELGLFQRVQRRAVAAWYGGRSASRQLANLYRFVVPSTGSDSGTAKQTSISISVVEQPAAEAEAAQKALALRRREMEDRLRKTWMQC
jgi:hypothetical protein